MQIGIDLGASKIEFVLLDKEGNLPQVLTKYNQDL